ncbi:YwdI family protein [Bacillus timonensis]|nr:YwdI family protein [Bacillus timonensis]
MNISVHKILDKMTVELEKARNASNEDSIYDSLRVIHTLSELVLEQGMNQPVPSKSVRQEAVNKHEPVAQSLHPSRPRAVVEDDANGDSLFDF